MATSQNIQTITHGLSQRARLYAAVTGTTALYIFLAQTFSHTPVWSTINIPIGAILLLVLGIAASEFHLHVARLKHQQTQLDQSLKRERDLMRRISQQRQSLLNQISRALVDRLDYNQMPDDIPEQIAQLCGADVVIVWTTAKTKPVSFKLITHAGIPDSIAETLKADNWYIPAFELPDTQKTQHLIEQIPVTPTDMLTHFCARHQLATAALTPITGRNQLVGLVGVFYRHPTALSTDLTTEMLTVANLIASAIQAEELYRDLIQSQKVETIGSLASGIAHDFNNVLAAILACATYVKQHTPQNSDIFRYLEATESSAHRGAALTKQLLHFARRDQPRLTVFDPNTVIDQTLQLVTRSFDKSILCHRQLAADLHPIEADPTQLEQVILNIAVNARDAMPQGGIFTITTRNLALHSANPHRLNIPLPDGPYVLLSFRDTGSGMPPDVIQKIFQPFFTTKPVGKGTGLGLSMVMSIVKSFGGHIHVSSAPGKGTQFDIYLPATDKPLVSTQVASSSPVQGGTETILLAEDEDIIREMAKITLEAKGYRVLTAPDGAAAITIYREHWRGISLVIADMIMPRMSGPELIVALREINPAARVIVSSGFSHDQEGRKMLEHGCLAYLQKPYVPDALCRITRQVLDSGL